MRRTAAALVALLVFPGILLAQEEPREEPQEEPQVAQETGPQAGQQLVHTVVRGETLWGLARRYYDNPFFWRNIYEANTEHIQNPHWIYPGQHFVIPGIDQPGRAETAVTGVEVEGPPPEDLGPMGPGGVYPGRGDPTVFAVPPRENTPKPGDRTSFYRSPEDEMGVRVLEGEAVEHLAVPRDVFYSASWLARVEETRFPGSIVGWARSDPEEERRSTVRPYDRLRVQWRGEDVPAPGDLLQTVRIVREIEDRGRVVRPTGMVRVVERLVPGLVVVATNEYDRLQVGDWVLPAPTFPLEPGQHPSEVEEGPVTRILGFGRLRSVEQLGDVIFLDVGRSDGVRVGDEFVLEVSAGGGWSGELAGRAQIVRVFQNRASARITQIVTPAFREGMRLRTDRRMP